MDSLIAISIIIPSYNREATIEKTINSIFIQNFNLPIEIIIGDDNSNQNTKDILLTYQKKYPEIIKIIFHKQNIGLGANWASCVSACTGKYICNCDNDDFWHNPDKLQMQFEFMEANLQYGVCHTNYRIFNKKTNKYVEKVAYNVSDTFDLQTSIMNGDFNFSNATFMYRSELLFKYLKLDDYIKFQFTLQDWNTWMILSAYTKFYCLQVSTSTILIDNDSITRPNSIGALELRLNKEMECYKYVCDLFPEKFPFDENKYKSHQNHVLLNFCYRVNDYNKANEYSKRINEVNFKVLLAKNILTFKIFCFFKNLINR